MTFAISPEMSPSHTDPDNQLCSCTTERTCTTTCTTITAVASVLSAILVACVSAVIHIAVCVYYGRTKINHTTHSAGDVNTVHTEAVYEEVSEGNEVLEMKQNQAYSSFPLQQ